MSLAVWRLNNDAVFHKSDVGHTKNSPTVKQYLQKVPGLEGEGMMGICDDRHKGTKKLHFTSWPGRIYADSFVHILNVLSVRLEGARFGFC